MSLLPSSSLQPTQTFSLFSLSTLHSHNFSPPQTLTFHKKLNYISSFSQPSFSVQNEDVDDHVIGDCLVFEDGIFEDPNLHQDLYFAKPNITTPKSETKRKSKSSVKNITPIEPENLVPEEWRHVQDEVNITKKEKRKIAQQLEFGVRVEKKRLGSIPLRHLNLQEYMPEKIPKLDQLKPLVLDNPSSFRAKDEKEPDMRGSYSAERVAPKNPRWAAYGKGFDDVTRFFNNADYEPGVKKSEGPRKLFTTEEKFLLNSRIPDLSAATSRKWLPLHTLAASGEFYLVDALLKHNIDINAVDTNGMTALHGAILGKKQAVTNYLLRESANPLVRDQDGATLMHYAVHTASSPSIKLLMLYNVDINLQDNNGWTPLHLAVQGRRTDIVKLLLIKGADRSLKNKDGLTPLGLCLYSGQDTITYQLIKLLKEFPNRRTNPYTNQSISVPSAIPRSLKPVK